jgi:aminomethyltransferase
VAALKLHHACVSIISGVSCFAARTGYTGELGYELNIPADSAGKVWDLLLATGQTRGLKPAGLGARDLLRLEMGYLLYGNDIGEGTTPVEAGAEWTVSFEKGKFIGSKALVAQKQTGTTRRFVGFELLEKAVPRHGFTILSPQPQLQAIGEVTSGNLSPLLQKGIGLGYVSPQYAGSGTAVMIDIRGRAVPAKIVKTPFYRRAKA